MTPFFALSLLGGGLFMLSEKQKAEQQQQTAGHPQHDAGVIVPRFIPPGAVATVTDIRENGLRYLKPEMAKQILAWMKYRSLSPVQIAGQHAPQPGLYKLIPSDGHGIDALTACRQGVGRNLAVLVSLSFAFLGDESADKLLYFTSMSNRAIATPNSQWAILVEPDTKSASVSAPEKKEEPLRHSFDAEMPSEIAKEVQAFLDDANVEPGALENTATLLEGQGFKIAAEALRKRASTLNLKKTLADARKPAKEHVTTIQPDDEFAVEGARNVTASSKKVSKAVKETKANGSNGVVHVAPPAEAEPAPPVTPPLD